MKDDPFRIPTLRELNQFIKWEAVGNTLSLLNKGFFMANQSDMTATTTTCFSQTTLDMADIQSIFNIFTYENAAFDAGKMWEKVSTFNVKVIEQSAVCGYDEF